MRRNFIGEPNDAPGIIDKKIIYMFELLIKTYYNLLIVVWNG